MREFTLFLSINRRGTNLAPLEILAIKCFDPTICFRVLDLSEIPSDHKGSTQPEDRATLRSDLAPRCAPEGWRPGRPNENQNILLKEPMGRNNSSDYKNDSLKLWGVVSMGTSVMIGTGIFALTEYSRAIRTPIPDESGQEF